MAEVRIRLGLFDRSLVLRELRLRLVELLVKVRRRDDREHVAFVRLAADVDVALADIACRAGKERRAVESRHIAGELDRARALSSFAIMVLMLGTASKRASKTASALASRLAS